MLLILTCIVGLHVAYIEVIDLNLQELSCANIITNVCNQFETVTLAQFLFSYLPILYRKILL